jgi:hypothetical protein
VKLKTLFIFIFISSICFAQGETSGTVSYGGNTLTVPNGYKSKSEYQISGNGFSAEWMYFPVGMDIQDIANQITEQFEKQLPLTEAKEITFQSWGNDFAGKKYLLDNKSYVVLGFGTVNEQPIFLNMSFKVDPKTNDDLDDVSKNLMIYK